MHLCTYTSTERKTEGSTPDCYHLVAMAEHPAILLVRVEGSRKQGTMAVMRSHTHCSWGRAHEQRASPAVCRPYSSQNAGASPNPPQHPILSTRRGGSKMFKKQPQVARLPWPRGNLALRPARGREDEEHLVSTDRATNRLSHQRRGGGGDAHRQPLLHREELSSLVMFFHTFIFYVLFLHCSFLLL